MPDAPTRARTYWLNPLSTAYLRWDLGRPTHQRPAVAYNPGLLEYYRPNQTFLLSTRQRDELMRVGNITDVDWPETEKNYSLDDYDYDFASLAKQSRDGKEKQRYLILFNLQSGRERSLIADMPNASEPTIKRTLKRFRETGAETMKGRPRSGVPSKLPRDQSLRRSKRTC